MCIHTYVYTYLSVYIPKCIHTYVYTYICVYMHKCTHIHTYTKYFRHRWALGLRHAHICVYARAYVYTHAHMHIYTRYTRTYVYTYAHMCIHTHVCVYIRTYLYTYAGTDGLLVWAWNDLQWSFSRYLTSDCSGAKMKGMHVCMYACMHVCMCGYWYVRLAMVLFEIPHIKTVFWSKDEWYVCMHVCLLVCTTCYGA